ncbi:hypothetical protein KIPB_000075, partial [Kipferlia bialata]
WELLELVLERAGIADEGYFGLTSFNAKTGMCPDDELEYWLDAETALRDVGIKDKTHLRCRLKVTTFSCAFTQQMQHMLRQSAETGVASRWSKDADEPDSRGQQGVAATLDPRTLELVYAELLHRVVAGWYPMNEKDSVCLAALALHAVFGDYDPVVHHVGFLREQADPSTYLPLRSLGLMPREYYEQLVFTQYSRHRKGSKQDAVCRYLLTLARTPFFGFTSIMVTDSLLRSTRPKVKPPKTVPGQQPELVDVDKVPWVRDANAEIDQAVALFGVSRHGVILNHPLTGRTYLYLAWDQVESIEIGLEVINITPRVVTPQVTQPPIRKTVKLYTKKVGDAALMGGLATVLRRECLSLLEDTPAPSVRAPIPASPSKEALFLDESHPDQERGRERGREPSEKESPMADTNASIPGPVSIETLAESQFAIDKAYFAEHPFTALSPIHSIYSEGEREREEEESEEEMVGEGEGEGESWRKRGPRCFSLISDTRTQVMKSLFVNHCVNTGTAIHKQVIDMIDECIFGNLPLENVVVTRQAMHPNQVTALCRSLGGAFSRTDGRDRGVYKDRRHKRSKSRATPPIQEAEEDNIRVLGDVRIGPQMEYDVTHIESKDGSLLRGTPQCAFVPLPSKLLKDDIMLTRLQITHAYLTPGCVDTICTHLLMPKDPNTLPEDQVWPGRLLARLDLSGNMISNTGAMILGTGISLSLSF